MEHHTDQVTSTPRTVGDTTSTAPEDSESLQEKNEALKEQILRLQQRESLLQKKLRRAVQRRQLRTKDYLYCLSTLIEKKWQLKEVERERQADAERWRRREEEWRVKQSKTNSLICILQDQLLALKKDKAKSVKRGMLFTQTITELHSREAMWKDTLRFWDVEVALRDNLWKREVQELQQEKHKDAERRQRSEEPWNICDLQQVPKAEKQSKRLR